MNWYDRLNEAIGYIEANLTEEVDMNRVAAIMGQSKEGFQRTFSILSDQSILEYIRRRRMTLAAFELQTGGSKVVDVALRYGYESPEAFSRAFQVVHGLSPSQARHPGASITVFPRLSFLLTLKGGIPMNYRIEKKEPFQVYGIEEVFPVSEQRLYDIPLFWQKAMKDGRFAALQQSTGNPETPIHAICCHRETGEGTFPYMLFAFSGEGCSPQGFTCVNVPGATWAIFTTGKHTRQETSGVLQDLIKRVYTEWLPTAPYEKIDGHELELYFQQGDDFYCETWIQVRPK